MADKKISALPAATTPLVGTEVLPIVQGGVTDQVSVANLTVGRDVAVKKLNPTDNVVMAAGKGIDFSANGGDVLSQYDEGTWTPTITAYAGTITTVGAVVGTYTRVGRLVTLSGSFAITLNGTGSVLLQITGLPFAATSGTPANFTGTGICPTTGKQLVLQYNVVAAKIYVSYYDGTYPGANASNYAFSITYEIS